MHPSASHTASRQSYLDQMTESIKDWVGAIRRHAEPLVNGVEARRSIALIEACYGQRKPLELPWLECGRVDTTAAILEPSR